MNTDSMADVARDASSSENAVARLLTNYIEQLEAGHAPDLDRLCAEHPGIAGRLRECLRSLQVVNNVAGMFSVPETTCHQGLKNFTLGDFRIEQEIGRGGMGVVYEAEQLSLGRRVALKVLPFAALLDKRQLERFKNEARAAAMLKHSNIVSVFQIGYERGIHYYAMELIDGHSLAELIESLRTEEGAKRRFESATPSAPSDTEPVAELSTKRISDHKAYYRSVAQVGHEAARALHYAHQEGVIHRDIKPSNLLIDQDGNPHIADFGLARIQAGREITLTGDVVGTLRYMSPEQVSGSQGVGDQRSDVYSLGVSLYELLTLQPAFTERERQRLLEQVISINPRRPRTIDPGIPRDLETIILKSIDKNLLHRYATAEELADDLDRFLKQRPIYARPPTRIYHLRQWVTRNRSLAALGSITLMVVLTLAILGPVFSVQYAALARQESLAIQSANESLIQSQADRSRLRKILFHDLIQTTEALASVAGMDDIQLQLLNEAVPYYEQLIAQETEVDNELRLEAAQAYFLLGRFHGRRGEASDANKWLDQALQLANQLEHDAHKLHLLVRIHQYNGNHRREPAIRLQHERRAVQLSDELIRLKPEVRGFHLLHNYGLYFLGAVLERQDRLAEALTCYSDAEDACRQLCELDEKRDYMFACYAQATCGVARIYHMQHQFDRAKEASLRADGFTQMMEEKYKETKEFRTGRAGELNNLADLMLSMRRPVEAESWTSQAIDLNQGILSGSPEFGWARRNLLESHLVRVRILRTQGANEKAMQVLNTVLRHEPDWKGQSWKLTRAAFWRGQMFWAAGHHDDARRDFQRALSWAELSCQEYPNIAQHTRFLAWILATCPDQNMRKPNRALKLAEAQVKPEHGPSWQLLGIVAGEAKQWSRALEALRQGAELGNGGDAFDRFLLARANWHLVNREEAHQLFQQAVERKDQPLGFWNYSFDGQLEQLESEVRKEIEIVD